MTDGLPRSRSVGLSAASAIHTQRNGDAGRAREGGKKKRPVRPSVQPASPLLDACALLDLHEGERRVITAVQPVRRSDVALAWRQCAEERERRKEEGGEMLL